MMTKKNTFEFTENTYILGVWFAEGNNYGNMQIWVSKEKSKEDWVTEIRFRYYQDGNIFDSDDKRSGMVFRFEETSEDAVIKKTRETFKLITMPPSCPFKDFHDELLIQGDVNKLIEKAKDSKWLHMRKKYS
jgi:hypothetical protein